MKFGFKLKNKIITLLFPGESASKIIGTDI